MCVCMFLHMYVWILNTEYFLTFFDTGIIQFFGITACQLYASTTSHLLELQLLQQYSERKKTPQKQKTKTEKFQKASTYRIHRKTDSK